MPFQNTVGKGEREKMLVTSIFSFSNNIFYPIRNNYHHLSKRVSSANCLNMDKSEILSLGKGLNSLKSLPTAILNLMKMADSSTKGQKHYGKRRNHSVFKGHVLQTCKNKSLFGKRFKSDKFWKPLKLVGHETCKHQGPYSPAFL